MYIVSYGLFAIILAQLVDINVLFSSIASSHALIEEALELAGGFALIAAAILLGTDE